MSRTHWPERYFNDRVRPWAEVVEMFEQKSGIKITKNAARSLHENALRKMRKALAEHFAEVK